MGKLKDAQVHLHINKDVTPVAQKARRIPFHLREKVDEELEHLLRQNDVIEDVKAEPSALSFTNRGRAKEIGSEQNTSMYRHAASEQSHRTDKTSFALLRRPHS